jgi:pimeloyl-ACP methyl ester carboxylesterase
VKRFRHLAYLEAGAPDAPPLFLLHGGTMTARWNWQTELSAFAARYRVIAPDNPGHGDSSNPRPELRYEDMAQDLLDLAAVLRIEHAAFYGFSDGGQIALELAIREPDFPSALVLSGVLHELTPAYRAAMLDFAGAPYFAEPAWSARQPTLAADCRAFHADWDALAPSIWELWMRPLELGKDRLARVAAPALILTGDRDPFVSLEQAVGLLRRLPEAELAVIPDAAHAYDERFTAVALQFLQRHVPNRLAQREEQAHRPPSPANSGTTPPSPANSGTTSDK